MEIIDNNKYTHQPKRHKGNGYLVAVIFIIVGLLFLGRNLGIVDFRIFHTLVSWPMLLIVIGIASLFRKHYFGGIILLFIGGFFLLPRITNMDISMYRTYWPVIFILIGIMILFKRRSTANKNKPCGKDITHQSEDGFLESENIFGAVRHIVLDPVFRGATVKNTFAGTVIDLRRTTLEDAEVYIDIDCTFGGIEIYAPNNWYIISELKAVFGGFNDKRYQNGESLDATHKLIIRGGLNFSGVEIKS